MLNVFSLIATAMTQDVVCYAGYNLRLSSRQKIPLTPNEFLGLGLLFDFYLFSCEEEAAIEN